MENRRLQKEILKFIINKYCDETYNKGGVVNDISIEFKNQGCTQEKINENLYSLAKNGKISSGKKLDDENHGIYSPLFVLDKGLKEIKPWWRKHLTLVISTTIAASVNILTYLLNYFKK